MEDMAIPVTVDGVECVFDRSGLDSPVMVHKIAKMQRAIKEAGDDIPQISPMDMDFVGERIFGTEQWEDILYRIDGKGIAYTWRFVTEAMGKAAEKVGEVKNS